MRRVTLGEAISATRAEYGVSVDELSRATRIRPGLIRQIEHDDFSGCGGAVYAKGHLRAIATYLDLDPDPLIREYERAHGSDDGPAPSEIFEREVIAKKEPTGPNWTAAMAVAAAIAVIVAVVSLVSPGAKNPGPVAEQFPTAAASPSSSPAAVVPLPDNSAPDLTAGLLTDTGVAVRVSITGTRCWIRATVDGVAVYVGTLTSGSTKDFHGTHEVKLLLGNAGAVDLVVNGKDLGAPGGPGTTRTVTFGPGTPG